MQCVCVLFSKPSGNATTVRGRQKGDKSEQNRKREAAATEMDPDDAKLAMSSGNYTRTDCQVATGQVVSFQTWLVEKKECSDGGGGDGWMVIMRGVLYLRVLSWDGGSGSIGP